MQWNDLKNLRYIRSEKNGARPHPIGRGCTRGNTAPERLIGRGYGVTRKGGGNHTDRAKVERKYSELLTKSNTNLKATQNGKLQHKGRPPEN